MESAAFQFHYTALAINIQLLSVTLVQIKHIISYSHAIHMYLFTTKFYMER